MAGPSFAGQLPSLVASDVQLAAALDLAGWPRGNLAVMIAIGLAESGGNVFAVSAAPDGSHGLGAWQIEYPTNSDVFTQYAPEPYNWAHVTLNAAMAKSMYAKQGYGAWSSYTSGRYSQFMARGNAAAAQVPANGSALNLFAASGPSGPDYTILQPLMNTTVTVGTKSGTYGSLTSGPISVSVGNSVLNGIDSAVSAVSSTATLAADTVKFMAWITTPANLWRVVEVVGGSVMLMAGLYIMARPAVAPVVQGAGAAGKVVTRVAEVAAA